MESCTFVLLLNINYSPNLQLLALFASYSRTGSEYIKTYAVKVK